MRGSLWTVAAVAAMLMASAPAAADVKAYDVDLLEGQDCPEEPMCIHITAANGTANGTIEDPYANLAVEGEHPIVLNVTNEGNLVHNLTFEPNSTASEFSHDEPLPPGASVEINLTTIEDVPPGNTTFYSGQGADESLGMVGELTVQSAGAGNGTDGGQEGTDGTVGEGNVTPEEDAVPGLGPLITAGLLGSLAAARAWRKPR